MNLFSPFSSIVNAINYLIQKPKANGLSLTLIADDLRRLVDASDIYESFRSLNLN